MRSHAPLLVPLFRSDSQARLLTALFVSADQEFNIGELAVRIGLAYGSTHREVQRLLDAGILAERRVGHARLVRPNPESPLAGPLRQLLVVAFGPVPLLRAALGGIAGIESVALFGSYAARLLGTAGAPPRDVDVLVIGAPEPAEIFNACEAVARQVDRPVNPTILTAEEFGADSGFTSTVAAGALIAVVGQLPRARAGVAA